MRERADEDAKKQEADILKDINETMDDFIAWLKDENEKKYDGVSLNTNIDRIEKLNADLREDVVGFIGRKLSNHFDDFYDRIKREAIRELIKTIEESVKKQSESIEGNLAREVSELRSTVEAPVGELDAINELLRLKRR